MTRESLVTSTDRLASAHSSCEVVSPREWTSHCCPVKLTTCFIRYCRQAVLAAADDMPLLPVTPVVGANVSRCYIFYLWYQVTNKFLKVHNSGYNNTYNMSSHILLSGYNNSEFCFFTKFNDNKVLEKTIWIHYFKRTQCRTLCDIKHRHLQKLRKYRCNTF